MYDLDRNVRRTEGQRELVPDMPYGYAPNIAAASFLYWGEHCVECAEPACYETCDLYVSRPDGRCRRFARGIVRNLRFPSARGYGAEVSFKKWGKLEARGNTVLMEHRWLMLVERLLGGSQPLVNLLGTAIWRISGDTRWRSVSLRTIDRAVRKVHSRSRRTRPDAFLLEIFNPAETTAVLHVIFGVPRKALKARTLGPTALLPSFRNRLELPPGYSRHEISYAQLATVTESGLPFDIALIPEADSNPTLVFLSADFVRFAREWHGTEVACENRSAVRETLNNGGVGGDLPAEI